MLVIKRIVLLRLPKHMLNPLYTGNPYMSTFANSEDPDEMQHNAFDQGLHCLQRKKRSSDKIIEYFFQKYNLTPLDMYNGLSHVYWIKPEGRIHWYTKG